MFPSQFDLIIRLLRSNVMEHLVDPSKAFAAMAAFVKVGGLLVTIAPWAMRYHAEDSYGDYSRFSARELEYMCIQNGLNPIDSGYDAESQVLSESIV